MQLKVLIFQCTLRSSTTLDEIEDGKAGSAATREHVRKYSMVRLDPLRYCLADSPSDND